MFMRLVIFIMVLQSLVFAAPGDLDTSFGTDGIVITSIGDSDDESRGIAIQSDGKIVSAGSMWTGSKWNFALVRYNIDGTPDTSFGTDDNGIVVTSIGDGWDKVSSVAIQSDGKIIVAGSSNRDFALVRYDTDGILDEHFGNDGIVITDIGGDYDVAYSVAVNKENGKIVVAGMGHRGSGIYEFALVSYDDNGSLDTNFDNDGIVTTFIGASSHAYSVAIQSDGKIVAGGESAQDTTSYDFTLVRYDTNGSLDLGFGTDGIAITSVSGVTAIDKVNSIAIQSDGKIVAAGYGDNGPDHTSTTDFALARYNPDGILDEHFGNDGIVITDIGGRDDHANSVTIQSDGKIVAVGDSTNDNNKDAFALVRYDTNGSLDIDFGTGGIVTTLEGNNNAVAYDVAIQSDSKIVAAGVTWNADGSDSDFILMRYQGAPTMVLSPIYYLLGM